MGNEARGDRMSGAVVVLLAAGLVWLGAACGGAVQRPAAQAPAALAPAAGMGEECVVDADCATGMCDRTVPGGYCTRACRASEDCGRRGWCDWDAGSGTGFCMQRCQSQRECRSAEFECFAIPDGGPEEGVCAWNAAERAPAEPNIGAPCRADVECMAPEGLDRYCLMAVDTFGNATRYVGGYCIALGCTADEACGEGARCAREGRMAFCATACEDDSACREGYACHPEQRVCAPR
ncbi:MAG: hypothetical protein EA398_12760 [Deltaproteobacteria bacterium]|nr:MAG: hypothetical protein EA398_12760 [Deltaproteobacteria bacterium]